MSKRIEYVNSPHRLKSTRRGLGKNRYDVWLNACERIFIANGNQPIHVKDLLADARTKEGRRVPYTPPNKGATQALLKDTKQRFVRKNASQPIFTLSYTPKIEGEIKNG